MITMLLVATLVGSPKSDAWFGADKVKHFLISAFVHSTAFSLARTAGVSRPSAQIVGGASAAAASIWKEIHDRRSEQAFSVADLSWDAAGALAAASLLNGTRGTRGTRATR